MSECCIFDFGNGVERAVEEGKREVRFEWAMKTRILGGPEDKTTEIIRDADPPSAVISVDQVESRSLSCVDGKLQ